MNLFEKLLNITNDIAIVNKNLVVGEGKTSYKAVGEADVLKAVKELEAKYKVFSYPKEREIVDREILETEKTYNGQTQKTTKQFMRIRVLYRFVDIEKPEDFIEITSYGDGLDSGDKAPGKAMTYADKYALMKAYKIVTGDDPDQNQSGDENWKKDHKEKSNKITELEAKTIYAMMTKKGWNVIELLKKNYGIENTADLNKEQYTAILKACNEN